MFLENLKLKKYIYSVGVLFKFPTFSVQTSIDWGRWCPPKFSPLFPWYCEETACGHLLPRTTTFARERRTYFLLYRNRQSVCSQDSVLQRKDLIDLWCAARGCARGMEPRQQAAPRIIGNVKAHVLVRGLEATIEAHGPQDE